MCHDYGPNGREIRWETTVAEERAHNIHARDGVTEDEFVAMREARDKMLDMPKLIIPSLQVQYEGWPVAAEGRQWQEVPEGTGQYALSDTRAKEEKRYGLPRINKEDYAVGSTITAAQVAEIKAASFKSVISDQPDGGDSPAKPTTEEIGPRIEAAGLTCRHIPVVADRCHRRRRREDGRRAIEELEARSSPLAAPAPARPTCSSWRSDRRG